MADPATQAAIESTAAAGVIVAVTGTMFGMDAQSIMAGFVGALVAASFVPAHVDKAAPAWKRYVSAIGQLVAAALLAGLIAPLASPFVAHAIPGTVSPGSLNVGTAGLIGIAAPVLVPLIRRKAKKL